jgi:hypothetical protein
MDIATMTADLVDASKRFTRSSRKKEELSVITDERMAFLDTILN